MKKFNLKYSEIIEAMDRRSFLKFLGKAPAAAAAQTSLGNIKQAPSLLNSAIKIVNMFKPIGLGLSGELPTNDVNFTASSFGDMSLATGDLKSQLLKIAFKSIKQKYPLPHDIINNTIKGLDDTTNDFANMQSFIDDGTDVFTPQNLHTSAYDENFAGAQIAINKALLLIKLLGSSNPNFEQFLKANTDIDLNNPEYVEEVKNIIRNDVESENAIYKREHQLQQQLNQYDAKEHRKNLLKQKRKQGRKKEKERTVKKELKQNWKEKQTNYPRFDRAGGSEDQGYAQTFESFFKENYADGKKPGRKGLAKRSGVNTKASVSSLRKTAKNSTGEKARMAHWMANMKAGKKKAKK